MKLTFLGTGTSQGVPVIGSTHPVCLSKDFRDKRFRTSAIITTDDSKNILIDCGPDFRIQMLSNNLSNVDAVLITHEHNDHVIGLDDLRPIIFRNRSHTPLYSLERVAAEIQKRFPYAFEEDKYPGAPGFDLHIINKDSNFSVAGTSVTPIEINHYRLKILGYRIKDMAYLTDASSIPPDEVHKLQGLDVLVINCLRREDPHPAHFILPEVLEVIQQIQPKQAYLTHISHLLGFHEEVEKELPTNVRLAYDGLQVEF